MDVMMMDEDSRVDAKLHLGYHIYATINTAVSYSTTVVQS